MPTDTNDYETVQGTDQRDFEYRIECKPDFAYLTVQVPAQ